MKFKFPGVLLNSNNDGPPDLDQLLSQALKKMKGRNNSDVINGKDGDFFNFNFKIIGFIVIVLWALSGIYVVKPAEQGVELRFGKYLQTTAAGLHWIPRIICSKYILNVEKIYTFSHNAQMLTRDENIVDVALSLQYRIKNPEDFLFNVKDPEYSLIQATASAVRQVVGHTSLDDILTDGRAQAREQMLVLVKDTLNNYKTGIEVTDLNLQPIKPPEAVTSAFDDAIKAREDEQRYINKALAYKEKVVLIAQGQAERQIQEADAYAKQIVLSAKAGIASYLALLPEHNRSPRVTDFRLYTDALETVFSATRKILLEGDSKAQIMVWPSKVGPNNLDSSALLPGVLNQVEESDSLNVNNQATKTFFERKSYSDHK